MIRDRIKAILKRVPRVAWDAHSNSLVFVKTTEVKAEAERLTGHKRTDLPETNEVGNNTTRAKSSRSAAVGKKKV